MIRSNSDRYTDAQRMELRSYVNLAGEVVARLWPMRTFISRNPLQGFEHLHFDEALEEGKRYFGGNGYLAEDVYREAFRVGHIREDDLNQVLKPLTSDKSVSFGERQVSQLDVLRTAMINGIGIPPACETAQSNSFSRCIDGIDLGQVQHAIQQALGNDMCDALPSLLPSEYEGRRYSETMATWCDRTLGTDLMDQINRQMIKWCAAFCDEGEAAWPMPHRELTFFRAWKMAAQHDLSLRWTGIARAAEKVRLLPDRPEDALLESLEMLKVPTIFWQEYFSLHLAALPGWAGFIKWRSEQSAYPWQESYRIDLNKYLAVRLFYERELVADVCRTKLHCAGNLNAIEDYARRFPYAVWVRRALVSRSLPKQALQDAIALQRWWKRSDATAWNTFGRRWYETVSRTRQTASLSDHTDAIVKLAKAFEMKVEAVRSTAPSDLVTLVHWLRTLTPHQRALKWLEASEWRGQQEVLEKLRSHLKHDVLQPSDVRGLVRPLAQFMFCIDVRSEVFRRHLEARTGYDTFGFAGFFGVPVLYRSFDGSHDSELCPVLIKPKHVVKEIPRTYQAAAAQRRKSFSKTAKAWQELLHDLKHNVITPYVMVEAIGWLFAWPLLGKTFFPTWYHRLASRLRNVVMPPVATTLTVDKLTTEEAEEMLAVEQRMQILRWLREHHRIPGSYLTPERLENIRLEALGLTHASQFSPGELARLLGVSNSEETRILEELRHECRITARDSSNRIERLTRTGFTEKEQVYHVETALHLMGLTSGFGRLVFVCAHGSTSENNPYESALDCGACGGSHGLPNARAFATMANKPRVRELLAQRGIVIPSDTHFVAALHDTATEYVQVADLEDVPSTHRDELSQVLEEVRASGAESAAERYAKLHSAHTAHSKNTAIRAVAQRAMDWSQVRPEWGLARNNFFIIAKRSLTLGTNLDGRSFLHSYDYRTDEDGRLLEFIMTAPLIVAQWINAEYYFSTVDPEIYGSGSKVYHNVTGRIGVMSGNQSDLRMGLPIQTVMDGTRPYHEPKRLTALIEAPRGRILAVIKRQPLLEKLFDNQWLRLVVLDPKDGEFHHYHPKHDWKGGTQNEWLDVASDERNQDRRAGRSLEVHH